jgi:hypothetical protein
MPAGAGASLNIPSFISPLIHMKLRIANACWMRKRGWSHLDTVDNVGLWPTPPLILITYRNRGWLHTYLTYIWLRARLIQKWSRMQSVQGWTFKSVLTFWGQVGNNDWRIRRRKYGLAKTNFGNFSWPYVNIGCVWRRKKLLHMPPL